MLFSATCRFTGYLKGIWPGVMDNQVSASEMLLDGLGVGPVAGEPQFVSIPQGYTDGVGASRLAQVSQGHYKAEVASDGDWVIGISNVCQVRFADKRGLVSSRISY